MKKSDDGSKSHPPESFPDVTPRGTDMPMYSAQALFEIQHTLGRMEAKLENVEKQNAGIDNRLGSLETKASRLSGVLVCGMFLLPLMFGVIWWSLGERIESALQINGAQRSDAVAPAPPRVP